jgi:predicted nucleic acid-binding protein
MSKRLWVVNASPIISLANIEHAHLLPDSCDQMIIPRVVEHEILDGSDDDLAKHWISTTGQQWVQDIGSVAPLVAAWDLGAGESAVLSWSYQHPKYQAVVNDLAARKFAKAFGMALCGTIGVIVIAKKVGIIPDVKPLLKRLIDVDFRIDDRLYQTALRLAGETP